MERAMARQGPLRPSLRPDHQSRPHHIANLAGAPEIGSVAISEAIYCRSFDRELWRQWI